VSIVLPLLLAGALATTVPARAPTRAAAPVRRIRFALIAIALVLVGGSAGYVLLGFSVLDAIYQTVTTVTTGTGSRDIAPMLRALDTGGSGTCGRTT